MMQENVGELIQKSQWLRREVLNLVVKKQRGHIPSIYSMTEIMLALYYGGFVNTPADRAKRDRVIVSKGHAAMGLYPILVEKGLVDKSELERFTDATGQLRMYADHSIPGIESVTGSLGHGVGIACGYALAAKMDKQNYNTYAILGDGECYEGSIWETAMFAAHYRLNNFCMIVDRNGLCIVDETEKCIQLEPLAEKFQAFGFEVRVVDGHRYKEILPALHAFAARKTDKPTAIIARTVKGKGISFMEGKSDWHNKMLNAVQAEQALIELATNSIRD